MKLCFSYSFNWKTFHCDNFQFIKKIIFHFSKHGVIWKLTETVRADLNKYPMNSISTYLTERQKVQSKVIPKGFLYPVHKHRNIITLLHKVSNRKKITDA